ncbi:MAG TPA: glycogen debranching N-terminal domain-containing protein [Vicinamibacterales bacterium]|nr:glycogen debranching N-terminal domain-containing protein [Vicinamibacterales bacterium]
MESEAAAPAHAADDAAKPLPEPSLARVVDVDPHHGHQLICHGYTVLLSNADGTITPTGRQGLFDHDTRVLSRYEVLLDGTPPRVDSSGLVDASRWMGRLTVARSGGDANGPALPQDTLELTIRRQLGNGMLEQIDVSNHSMVAATTRLTIRLDADFRDIAEIGSRARAVGRNRRAWDEQMRALTIHYHASHQGRTLHRALRARVLHSDSPARGGPRRLTFDIALPPQGAWHAELVFEILIDGEWRTPEDSRRVLIAREAIAADWHRERVHIESNPSAFGVAFERAADDLAALRNWEHDAAPDAWVPNGGVPTYTGLFGRDALTAGWQAALLGPEILRGAIARLAATQSRSDSAWHDAEPGKMIHEMRRGPLSELDVIPQRGYYGTLTSSSFFVITLAELWHWTGDTDMLNTYLDAARRTFEWADRYGDRDGDGFLEYERRSARGLKNQAWKDSDEAIRYADGALVDNPIATVEEQAYHWLALRRMAEILLAVGKDEESEEFLERARRVERAWHEAFWMEDEGFYAMALDPAKRRVRSIGSNAGHALAAGLVPWDRARRVADRLMAPDLFSGWGVRTLSSKHPSYNPLAYHLGTVWPVENATFVLGFKRYGLDEHVERLVTAMFDAAARFRYCRLPEALGGHSRDEAPVPTVYPASNSPQAWSASAVVQVAQTILGIYPFAPAHVLALVRPALPRWLKTVVVRNIRVGASRVSLQFERRADGSTTHHVFDKTGPMYIVEVPPPQRTEGSHQSWRDAVAAWIVEHAPGRAAAAARIALRGAEEERG